jgi:G:T/U-mismatch repair DNA glycosylase
MRNRDPLENDMLPEIWEPKMKLLFVGMAAVEPSETLGFHHLHPRDRFWELLENGGITPTQIISKSERKALADGHAKGNLSDPIRAMFIQKKTSQLLRLGVGITDLNRSVAAASEKDKAAQPGDEDIASFIGRVEDLAPAILAFVTPPDVFVGAMKSRFPSVTPTIGLQTFRIKTSEVWFLGSTIMLLRGEALTAQEDAFFALGEKLGLLMSGGSPE